MCRRRAADRDHTDTQGEWRYYRVQLNFHTTLDAADDFWHPHPLYVHTGSRTRSHTRELLHQEHCTWIYVCVCKG